MALTRRGVVWIDAQGENLLHVMTGVSSMSAVQSGLAALSNAGPLFDWEAEEDSFSPAPTSSVYPTVRVQAVLIFQDSSTASIAKLYVPAPLSSIFLSDGVTVDPSAIGSLISAVEGVIVAGSGNPVDTFVGGQIIATKINAIASLQPFSP